MPPLSRRTALTGGLRGAGVLLLAGLGGCSDVRFVTGPEATPAAVRGPDDDARDALVADAQDLLARAVGVAAAQPAAQRVVEACTAHLVALGADAAGATTAAGPVTATAAQDLADALAATAGRALTLRDGTSGGTARLAVSLGASRAVLLDGFAAAAGVVAPAVTAPAAPAPPTPGAPTPDAATASPSTSTSTSTPDPDAPADDPGTVALQGALAGEHAAVHGFGLVVGRVDAPRRARALADLDGHRVARDDLVDLLLDRGAAPVEALTSYDVVAQTPEAAGLLAAALEDRLAGVYADVVAAGAEADGRDDRGTGAVGVLRSARSARDWGSTVTAFPGLAELAEDGTPVATPTS